MENTLIIILTRMVSVKSYSIYHRYFRKYPIIFISDYQGYFEKNNIFYYPDELLQKESFFDMTTFKNITAWDKLIYHLKYNNNYSYYWIIEDDVYFNNQIEYLINNNNYDDEDLIITSWTKHYSNNDPYYHWSLGKDFFDDIHLSSSINVICRISNNLLKLIIDFQIEYNKLILHEILFISLINKFNLKYKQIIFPNSIIFSSSQLKLHNQKLLDKILHDNINIYHPFKNWHNFIL